MAPSASAATGIRSKFFSHGSNQSGRRLPTMSNLRGEGENGSAQPNESSHLLSGLSVHKYTESGNPVVKYPSIFVDKSWKGLISNYVNIFLVFVPLGIIAGLLHWNPTVIFILNFLAIIPLASLLAFATEEVAVPLGQTIGGLLNATFGNAVELIVSVWLCTLSVWQLIVR